MRVSIIDDDPSTAEGTAVLIEGAGHEPVFIHKLPRKVAEAATLVVGQSDALVCDHRLQPRNLAKYYGAELVASVMQLGKPGVLLSQFIGPDNDVSIRRWRKSLPVVLARDALDVDRIAAGLDFCAAEIAGNITPERRAVRQLFRVEDTGEESRQKVADVVVPGWRATKAVRIPLDLFPKDLRKKVKRGARFFALINVGAQSDEELFFEKFELAAAPDDTDGLK
ncbi:MAG: hypothetical protein JNJ54_13645 [Myxococcaceae bacterium]|nr:hypothetical protein [Myxococcaceae bacterium]